MTIPAGETNGLDCQINVPVYEDYGTGSGQDLLRRFEQCQRRDHCRLRAKATGTIVPDPTGSGAASAYRPNVDHGSIAATDGSPCRSVLADEFHVLPARYANQSGPADVTFAYGPAGAGWIPIAGDWDGDGTDTIGLYNPATSTFYLRNTTSLQGPSDLGYADVVFHLWPGRGRLDPHRRRLEWRRQGHHRPV